MSNRQNRIDGETFTGISGVVPLYLTIDADNTSYQMNVNEQIIIAITALSDAAAIIILPSVAEAAGRFYFLRAPTGSTAGDISIYEKETGAEYAGQDTDDGDLDADNDFVLLFSDGNRWNTICNGVA